MINLNKIEQELEKSEQRKMSPVLHNNKDRNFNDDRQTALECLKHLNACRADNYKDWLEVGMILHSAGCGLNDWDLWSRQSSKYETEVCANKWETFDDCKNNAVTIATLIKWAQEDGNYKHQCQWPQIIRLNDFDLPEFPVDVLPEPLRFFILEVTQSLQVPVDLPAMLAISVLSLAAGGKFEVLGKQDWAEPVNLYIVVVLPSGGRKSVTFSQFMKPIKEYEKELCDLFKPEIEISRSKFNILEAKQKRLEKSVAGGGHDQAELDEVLKSIAQFQHINEPVLVVSDVTVEAVGKLLAENEGRLGILSAEGGVFAIFAGRYSNDKPVNDIFLCGHAGDPIKVARVGRERDNIDKPAITMGLCIQPTILDHLGHKKLLRESGMLGRLLFSMPEYERGKGTFDTPPISEHAKENYHRIIRFLLELPVTEKPVRIELSSSAVDVFRHFYEEIEKRLAESSDLHSIPSWGAKLRGAVLRIAGLLQLAKAAESRYMPESPEIEKSTIESAIEIGRYLISHAKKAFRQLEMDADMKIAIKMISWMKKHNQSSFTQRELFEGAKGQSEVNKVDDLQPGIAILKKHGYLRQKAHEKNKSGRPSLRFEVNPLFFSDI